MISCLVGPLFGILNLNLNSDFPLGFGGVVKDFFSKKEVPSCRVQGASIAAFLLPG